MDELKNKIMEATGVSLELRRLLVEILAASTAYDNTDSGLTATTVQGAIDELATAE